MNSYAHTNIFKPLVLLGLLLLSVATQAQTPSLVGHWYSEQVENYGNVFATREFRFTQLEGLKIYAYCYYWCIRWSRFSLC